MTWFRRCTGLGVAALCLWTLYQDTSIARGGEAAIPAVIAWLVVLAIAYVNGRADQAVQ